MEDGGQEGVAKGLPNIPTDGFLLTPGNSSFLSCSSASLFFLSYSSFNKYLRSRFA